MQEMRIGLERAALVVEKPVARLPGGDARIRNRHDAAKRAATQSIGLRQAVTRLQSVGPERRSHLEQRGDRSRRTKTFRLRSLRLLRSARTATQTEPVPTAPASSQRSRQAAAAAPMEMILRPDHW